MGYVSSPPVILSVFKLLCYERKTPKEVVIYQIEKKKKMMVKF